MTDALTSDDVYVFPTSFAQRRLWFMHQLAPQSPAYNIPAAFRLRGPLDVAALERALATLVERHEALRTTIDMKDGEPVQVVASSATVALATVELGGLPASEREAEMQRLVQEEAAQPFDLATGPLFRAGLVRLTPEDHALTITIHHIVADGWSMGVVSRELEAAYAAALAERPAELPALPLQYADFALWQQEWLQGEVLREQLRYWTRQLAGPLPLVDLPRDRPRPAVERYRGAWLPLVVPGAIADRARALGRKEGVSLYTTLLTAFKALLARYTGQSDIVVGALLAGRTTAEVEGLVGFFINSIVFRTDVGGDPTARELLARVREVTAKAFANPDVPFERLVQELAPERDMSHNPLYQVSFSLQNQPMTLSLRGLACERLDLDNGTAKQDLFFELWEEGAEIRGRVEYNTDLFDRETIERVMAHYVTLLESFVEAPDARLSTLRLLPAGERERVLVEFNATGVRFPAGRTIHGLFEAQVARMPDTTALVAGEVRWTYAQLDARANRLAHHLRALGVGPDVLVGVCHERTGDLVVALLAVLKAGGAYVPLDPAYPADRVRFMLEDSQAAVLLTTTDVASRLPSTGARVVRLDAEWPSLQSLPVTGPAPQGSDANLAYVIYTSGSTGVPKGVAIEHRNAAVLAQWATGVFTADELRGVLFSTSVCFDLSVFELFVTLANGGTVILARDAFELPTLAARDEVTLVNTVPSAIAALLRVGGVPASVRVVNLAGEPLATPLVDAIYALGTVEKVYDLYGPSEDTTYSTYTLRRAGVPASIGRPIANTQAYVLDTTGAPVPIGVPGELYLGGDGLARGYLHRPELTRERFVRNPFVTTPGARLYRTGDLVRFRSDGTLEYLGRIDRQVKLRGFRIELGEIENRLGAAPAVRDCAVDVKELAPGDSRLVAWIVPSPGAERGLALAQACRDWLRETLPEYMIPAAFVELDALPMTLNGKVDRKVLPLPGASVEGADGQYEAPATPTERILADVWREALGIDRVSALDNFFDLGGHSLLSLRVLHQVEQRTGRRVNPRELVLQTLRQVALLIDAPEPVTLPKGARAGSLLGALRSVVTRST